jgi:glycosyltransferase involved in cell wall biosynthesis
VKKIVILVDQLNSHGGIEKLVAVKANYWATVFDYDVTIISTEQLGKPLIYPLSDKVKFVDLAINYHREKSYFSISNGLKFLSNIIKIQRYILKENPHFIDVASHIPITYFLPFLYRKSKIIKEFHFTKFDRVKQTDFKSEVLNYIESKYDFLVVLSEEERSFYASDNVVVIPNPIANSPQIQLRNIEDNENIAVAVVRFAAVKQLEKMIAIWSSFIASNPTWKLFIFGTIGNAYFKKIEQLVLDSNLQNSIFFKGQSDTIQSEIAKAKVVLMTSEQECFPLVILEANSVGIPVISFDCPTGPRNIIHHKIDGILVEYNNCDSFVKELVAFDVDTMYQKYLSKNAKENAYKYTIESIMNKWNELIFNTYD